MTNEYAHEQRIVNALRDAIRQSTCMTSTNIDTCDVLLSRDIRDIINNTTDEQHAQLSEIIDASNETAIIDAMDAYVDLFN